VCHQRLVFFWPLPVAFAALNDPAHLIDNARSSRPNAAVLVASPPHVYGQDSSPAHGDIRCVFGRLAPNFPHKDGVADSNPSQSFGQIRSCHSTQYETSS
jgi:hypothetical protein